MSKQKGEHFDFRASNISIISKSVGTHSFKKIDKMGRIIDKIPKRKITRVSTAKQSLKDNSDKASGNESLT